MISAIVVLYNPDIDHLNNFLIKLKSQVDHVILVDNTPNLETKKKLNNLLNFNQYIYIDLLGNKGIAFAHNVGIKKAKELGDDYVIIFDQDSNIENEFIKSLIDIDKIIRKSNRKVAALGPVYMDVKTQQIAPAIRFNGLRVERIVPSKFEVFTLADYIISSGSLISIEALDRIGLMAEELFIDYVDIEWGLRAKKLGYECFLANNVIMKHSIGDYSVKVPFSNKHVNIHTDFRKYFILRNALYLIFYSNLPLNWRFVQIAKTSLYFVFLVTFLPNKINTFKIFFKAIRDALSKNMYIGSFK